jgi:PPOX class probable FMN-dependent enzyme
MSKIETVEQLRQVYAAPSDMVIRKQLPALDRHCRRFIALSPFVVMGTSDGKGGQDVTPRGGAPGHVAILDDRRLALPDWPGNNRLDALTNMLERPKVGLLFMIPGVDETLRVNGSVEIRVDEDLLRRFETNGKLPRSVLVIGVEEAYLHCAKAFMRAKLWSAEAKVDRGVLPSGSQMIKDQLSLDTPAIPQEEVAERYAKTLY